MKVEEINFDTLVSPTHHHGGYAFGNIASMRHKERIGYPKKAALESLEKMKLLMDLGIPQGVLPCRMRPAFSVLRKLGFKGSDLEIVEKVSLQDPALFYALSSSSSMWTANCATVSPSSDTQDGKVHLTIANLSSQFHRSIEAEESYALFRQIFSDESLFAVHPPLPSGGDFGDEGAANHIRFCQEYKDPGTHLFVYGKSAFEVSEHRFPLRQAKEASEAIARSHGLYPANVVFARQNPSVIEEGVFHNDVISVGNKNLFLYHEKAFLDSKQVLQKLEERGALRTICVTEEMLSVKEAVKTYLFNGQLVTLPSGEDLLLLPSECRHLNLEWLPLRVAFIPLTESMRNGGGPACLRLRVVLNEQEKKALPPSLFLTESLYKTLKDWIHRYFREELAIPDLTDPLLLKETLECMEALTQILHLDPYYRSKDK